MFTNNCNNLSFLPNLLGSLGTFVYLFVFLQEAVLISVLLVVLLVLLVVYHLALVCYQYHLFFHFVIMRRIAKNKHARYHSSATLTKMMEKLT